MNRTRIAFLALVLLLLLVQPLSAQNAEPLNIRIGVQRGSLYHIPELYENLVNTLNEGLGREVTVDLLEFTSGPPLLEAFNSDSIDIGGTGDTPPIFAQAAGVPLVYVSSQLSSGGSAILVPENSPIQSVADLAGKQVAFTRGSSANLFVIHALRSEGLDYEDIIPIFLQPGDARAAFDGGSIDAWVIWDPFRTITLGSGAARSIFNSSQLPPTRGYNLASQRFVSEHPDAVQIILEAQQATIDWANENIAEYAAYMEEQTEVPADVWLAVREEQAPGDVEYITDEILNDQQSRADIFFELGLIPEQLVIADAVWLPEGIDPAAGPAYAVPQEENN